MNELEAIVHLYKRKMISEEKAYKIANSKGIPESEIKSQIESIKNPPVPKEEDDAETM